MQGTATLNTNEWFKYFNVRSNPVDLVAGNEYIVKIEPTYHSASSEIRSVDPEKRNCKFGDERGSIKHSTSGYFKASPLPYQEKLRAQTSELFFHQL